MAKKLVNTMVTAFRDGFQSVYGARVYTKDFLPAVKAACDAGIKHFEVGGGARFQSLYFYCNEDAFDMMDAVRETTGPEANLQTLARGINVVGLDSQPRDIIRLHAKLFKKHGITTIRNFDALNDVNNLGFSGRCIHEEGLQLRPARSKMLPVLRELARALEIRDADGAANAMYAGMQLVNEQVLSALRACRETPGREGLLGARK